MSMPRAPLRAVAAAIALALWLAPAAARAEVKRGDRAAELVNVKDRKGRKLELRRFRGSVIVLTFGASWCKPCRKELPAYDALARRYRKQKANVVFVAINIDSERANAERFLKDAGGVRHLSVGFDPQGNSVDKYEPGTMPTTYIIDGKGIVRAVHAGFESGDEKKIAAKVDELLARR